MKKSGPEAWIIDKAHSSVAFEVDHLVIATVEGRFKEFEGEINFDMENPKKTDNFSVHVKIDPSTINTDNEKRDKHLRSEDFFNVTKHKEMSFKSKKVSTTDGKKFTITGDLTIAGVTRSVDLDTKYRGSVSAYDVQRVSFQATTSIKREDFQLTWNNLIEGTPAVGSEISIRLKIEAKRKSDLS